MEIIDQKLLEYLRWNSYLSRKHKLLYVATPKVACTSLKWWFAALEGCSKAISHSPESGESSPELVIHDLFHKISPDVTGLSSEALATPLESDEYFRFAVVRNPYKRIFSAWQSKLLLREPLQVEPYLGCDFLYTTLEQSSDISSAFESFLEHLFSQEAPNYWDPHWTPQASQLRPDLINYTKIAQIENIQELKLALLKHLEPGAKDPFSSRPSNISLIPYQPDFITDRAAELIQLLYSQDFELFDYNFEKPESKEKFSTKELNVALRAVSLIRGRHQRLTETRVALQKQISKLEKQNFQMDLEKQNFQMDLEKQNFQMDLEKQNFQMELANYDELIVSLKLEIAEQEKKFTDQRQELNRCDEHILSLKKDLQAKDITSSMLVEQYNQITNSKLIKGYSWSKRFFEKVPGFKVFKDKIYSIIENLRLAKHKQLIATSGLFDKHYYLAHNQSVKSTGMDPIMHFLTEGFIAGRRPNPMFDPLYYLKKHPDVAARGMNPLIHYIRSGKQEGRKTQATLAMPVHINNAKDRFSSNECLLFVDYENNNKSKASEFPELLRWFYYYTALDVYVVRIGTQPKDLNERTFPILQLNPDETTSAKSINIINGFVGKDIKAIYYSSLEAMNFFHDTFGANVPSICQANSIDKTSNLLQGQRIFAHQKFIVHNELIATELCETLNVNINSIRTINVNTHDGLKTRDVSKIEKYSELLLWYFRDISGVKPAVSVIVPNFNHSRYLVERLDSIYSQSFRDFEVLLLDDSSTDNSLEILNKYATSFPEITRSLYNPINGGSVFSQWQKGAKNAVADILWIAESDDICENNFLQHMLPKMVNAAVMLSYCQSYCMGGEKHNALTYVDMGYYDSLGRDRWYNDYTIKGSEEITQFLAVYNTIPNVSSVLIRNVALDLALDDIQHLTISGDWLFYIKHSEGGKVAYLAQPLNYHRVHKHGVVNSNRNEILFNEFKEMHMMLASRYQLSQQIKDKMCSYVRDFVWPGLEQMQDKGFDESYEVDLLNTIGPGSGSHAIQQPHTPLDTKLKPIAFFLPQFHTIKENDEWWGKGFTEWTNTKKGKQFYPGHYQPRLPHQDLGFYDLSDWRTLERQADLAKQYGIHGFCFYHYWFDGTRLLEKPVNLLLEHPEIDFPFCLCWANENWTRCWDGFNKDILKAQKHSPEDDLAFIQDLSRYIKDPRYIRIDGKPLVLIYRPELLPTPLESVKIWKRWCLDNGIGEIYLAYMQGFSNPETPETIGFDAKIEFPPLVPYTEDVLYNPEGVNDDFAGLTLSYPAYVKQAILQRKSIRHDFPLFRSVMMAWDNTARRNERATIFTDFSLQTFAEWLADTVDHTRREQPEENQFFFINAWNEWAEGTYLEPDRKYGYSCLEAVRSAINSSSGCITNIAPQNDERSVVYVCHDAHMHGAQMLSLNIVREMKETFGLKVYLILLGDGILKEQFQKYSTVFDFSANGYTGTSQHDVLQQIKTMGAVTAYCSTVVSGRLVDVLKTVGFNVVTLVHELSSVIQSYGLTNEATSIAQKSDTIIFPGKKVLSSFQSSFPVEEEKCVIHPQGVFFDNPYKDNRQAAQEKVCNLLNLPYDSNLIVSIGYADLRKGVDLFVQTAKEFLQRDRNTYFIWVGHREQELALWLQHDISQFGLSDRILFVDATEDISHFYSGADIFLLPSREDPFPIVLLDALAAGTPVIGFKNAGGFEEIIDGSNGILVPYLDTKAMANEIFALLENKSAAAAMGKQGRKMIESDFNFKNYVTYLLSLGGQMGFR